MAVTRERVPDQGTILFDTGEIEMRYRNVVKVDGAEVAREGFHREVVKPTDDLAGKPEMVRAVAERIRTPEAIAAFHAKRAASRQEAK